MLESPKVVVTGHGIDTDRFRPARQPRDGAFHVMTVGRLSPSKRHDILIEAIARVRERGNSVRLSIVGEPRGSNGTGWMDRLNKQIDDLRLNDVVKLVGPVARPDLPPWYNSADVCVNLSETNSIDKAVLEAMSCGVPVITSNPAFGPVLRDIAPSLALRDSRSATVASALEMMMGMDDRTLSNLSHALREKVIREHNLGTLMDRLIELLSEPRR